MPETYKLMVQQPMDSSLPRDLFVNTLHFRHSLGALFATDLTSFADNVSAAFLATVWSGSTKRHTIKVYTTEGSPPHDPIVTKDYNAATAIPNAAYPREIALCLSFKGGQRPWQRGRLYIAPQLVTTYTTASTLTPRPPAGLMAKLLDLGDALAAAGGPDWSWVVHSPTRGEDTPVKDTWVDDEWDTQRRRGLRATTRTTRSPGS
jgi:hypothetical protein